MTVSQRLPLRTSSLRAPLALALALLAVLASPNTRANAVTAPELDEQTHAFIGPASGYGALDVDALEALLEAGLPPGDSAFLASGRLSPLAKAALVVEQADGSLPRARHHLTLRVISVEEEPGGVPVAVLFVQLDRYNLGPALRQELLSAVGEEHVAPLSEFGEGPHVSWRFVMQQVMGSDAALITAGRTLIAEDEAAAATCLGTSCLATASGIDELAAWHELVLADLEDEIAHLPFRALRDGSPVTATMLDLPARLTYFDPYAAESSSDDVFAEFLVESGLAQDDSVEAAFRQGYLLDDSLSAVWQRVLAFSSGGMPQFYAAQAYECRRGESGWAAPGELCL